MLFSCRLTARTSIPSNSNPVGDRGFPHLKSGCKVEELKLRTAERLVNLIFVVCFLSWRAFWVR